MKDYKKEAVNLFKMLKKNPTFDEHLTPYLHILVTHATEQFEQHRNLQKFSQQSPEHWMGLLQRTYMKHTNRRDTRPLHAGLNQGGAEAIKRLFVIARVRLLLTTKVPRSLPERSPRSDIGQKRKR